MEVRAIQFKYIHIALGNTDTIDTWRVTGTPEECYEVRFAGSGIELKVIMSANQLLDLYSSAEKTLMHKAIQQPKEVGG